MMRESSYARGRREAFITASLRKALEELTWGTITDRIDTDAGAPLGGPSTTAKIHDVIDGRTHAVDGPTMSLGWHALARDRKTNRHASTLRGISTATRDRLLMERSLNEVHELTADDCQRVLQIALFGEVAHQ